MRHMHKQVERQCTNKYCTRFIYFFLGCVSGFFVKWILEKHLVDVTSFKKAVTPVIQKNEQLSTPLTMFGLPKFSTTPLTTRHNKVTRSTTKSPHPQECQDKKFLQEYSDKIKSEVVNNEFVNFTLMNMTTSFNEPLYDTNDNISIALKLTETVPVVCYILTSPNRHRTHAIHVKLTWGRRCDRFYIFSTANDSLLNSIALNVTEGYWHLWQKTMAAVRYLHAHMKSQDQWFYKADDDTYAVVENLRYALLHFNASEPIAVGSLFRPGDNLQETHVCGGSGYVLSRASIHLLATESHKCFPEDQTGYEDVMISRCLKKLGGHLVETLDDNNKERFFQEPAHHFLSPAGLLGTSSEYFIERMYHPPEKGINCCSTIAASFHHLNPRYMYLMDYLVYFLKPFGISQTFHLEKPES